MRISPLIGLTCLLLAAPPALADTPPSTESSVATQKKRGGTSTKKKSTTKKSTTKKKTATKRTRKRSTRRTKKRDTRPVVEKLLDKGVIGLHVGGSLSYFECDCLGDLGEQEYGSVYGLAAGVYYDKAINRFLSYRGGLRYHGKGAAPEGPGDFEVNLTTVEVEAALLIRYTLNPFATLYLSGGGFLAGIFGVDATSDGAKSTAFDDAFGTIDYGLNIGGGAFFALSRSRGLMASATLNYSHGLANIGNTEKAPYTNEDNLLLSRAVMLTVGVHF